MCITLDQVSDTHNIVIEDNEFTEFSHFGVAIARINDVKIRNNTFYSRNLQSYNTYNQAIHLEEHTQNVLIENNDIDVILRNSGTGDPTSTVRSYGMIISDSRYIDIRNNKIKHNHIYFHSIGTPDTAGYSSFTNNILEDGEIWIKDSNEDIIIQNNSITNPSEYAIVLESVKPMLYPFGGHQIINNNFADMDGKHPFKVRGEVKNVTIKDNTFAGCNQLANDLQLYTGSQNLTIQDNDFLGLTSANAYSVTGSLPSGISLTPFTNNNTYNSDCSIDNLFEINFVNVPTEVGTGNDVVFEVNYTAFKRSDIVGLVNSPSGTWLNNDTKTVDPGTGTITLRITQPTNWPLANNYKLGLAIREVGGGYSTNYKDISTFFNITNANPIVSIQNQGGFRYINSSNSEKLVSSALNVGNDEKFEMVDNNDGTYSFKCSNGLYMSSENGNKEATCNRTSIGAWEKFMLTDYGNDIYTIKGNAPNDLFLKNDMTFTGNGSGDWQRFKITSESARTSKALTTDIQIEEFIKNEETGFNVYPNPYTVGDLKITLDNSVHVGTIQIVDTAGRIVYQSQLNTPTLVLNLNSLAIGKGLYIVRLVNPKKTFSKKLLYL
ncbi:T9SS type A sorting domain-containing protein [Ochrovirga pacifica]|uniref:T9SS type A sorting domain-containing protein n=1 Tax=Ochrovirga pacifica TaxID=1042376 RepID=UPI0002F19097|nr:right-handed parallel beta-helix repeat-containing protein [Ochrovirga pacifica]